MSGFNLPPGVSSRDIPGNDDYEEGDLSLRDYFAAHAPPAPEWWHVRHANNGGLEAEVMWAYAYADAMLQRRQMR